MVTQSSSTNPTPSRSTFQVICAIGAMSVGLVLLSYAVYFVPNKLAGSSPPIIGFLVFLAIVGLLSIIGAVGYWMGRIWGWYVHLASALGQLFFPGALFEFKLDLYHMIGWVSPVVSLIIVILMGINIRRRKRAT
jgi:uncharacterized membrane protein (DUF2068 family)